MAKLSKRSKAFLAIYGMCVPALWIIFFAVYSLVIVATLAVSGIDLPEEYDVKISVKGSRKDYHVSYDVKDSDDCIDGSWYVNFSRIADVCSFPVSGDPKVLRYKIENADGSADYLMLALDEEKIYVNSDSVCKNIIVRGDDVYLPADFINEYINGINIGIDDAEKQITVEVEGQYSLKLKDTEEHQKINTNELDSDKIESEPLPEA